MNCPSNSEHHLMKLYLLLGEDPCPLEVDLRRGDEVRRARIARLHHAILYSVIILIVLQQRSYRVIVLNGTCSILTTTAESVSIVLRRAQRSMLWQDIS